VEFARLGLAKVKHSCAHSRDPYAASRASRLAEKFVNRISRLESRAKPGKSGASLPVCKG
jgi:hypothetical protein